VKVVKIATKYRMPVIPYSGATSLEGQFRGVCSLFYFHSNTLIECIALNIQHVGGGICIDMSGMDRIIEIHGA
jgi:D-lactate dehydrogenase (cytochrome)